MDNLSSKYEKRANVYENKYIKISLAFYLKTGVVVQKSKLGVGCQTYKKKE